jgi:hypothetical protein
MSFGPSSDKRKLIGLVRDTAWNGFVELNRMAFADELPRNSESRALGVAVRLLRARAPHIEWIVSFADATQCGDGTIYRAAGWTLTGIKRNVEILQFPDGRRVNRLTLNQNPRTRNNLCRRYGLTNDGRAGCGLFIKSAGARPLPGFQLRYVGFVNRRARERLAVPVIPYSEIARQGASFAKGRNAREA